jgi:hypothetical protein
MKIGDLIKAREEHISAVLPKDYLGIILKMYEKVQNRPETCLVQWVQPVTLKFIPFVPVNENNEPNQKGVYRVEWLEVVE